MKSKKITTRELHDLMVNVNFIQEFGMGYYDYTHMDWWCDFCNVTLARKNTANFEYANYYRKIWLHYKYVHRNEIIMMQMAM